MFFPLSEQDRLVQASFQTTEKTVWFGTRIKNNNG